MPQYLFMTISYSQLVAHSVVMVKQLDVARRPVPVFVQRPVRTMRTIRRVAKIDVQRKMHISRDHLNQRRRRTGHVTFAGGAVRRNETVRRLQWRQKYAPHRGRSPAARTWPMAQSIAEHQRIRVGRVPEQRVGSGETRHRFDGTGHVAAQTNGGAPGENLQTAVLVNFGHHRIVDDEEQYVAHKVLGRGFGAPHENDAVRGFGLQQVAHCADVTAGIQK